MNLDFEQYGGKPQAPTTTQMSSQKPIVLSVNMQHANPAHPQVLKLDTSTSDN